MTQQKLFLREAGLEDAELLVRWFNDPDTVKYMGPPLRCKSHSKESVVEDLKDSDDSSYDFMVCVEGMDKPIGYAGIDDISYHDKRGELFYLVGEKDARRKGYGKRIVKGLMDYAFNELGLNSLLATSTIENKPSIAVLEKNGFRLIGVRRGYHHLNDAFLDELFFDITHEDYLKGNAADKNDAPAPSAAESKQADAAENKQATSAESKPTAAAESKPAHAVENKPAPAESKQAN